jgi:hypothetical protein
MMDFLVVILVGGGGLTFAVLMGIWVTTDRGKKVS